MYYFCRLQLTKISMNERMKKIIFVVNPISGTQSKELILSLLNEKIDKARYSWEVVYTERAGHAVEIAAKAAEEKADIVVAIGGDGTINEMPNLPSLPQPWLWPNT